MTRSAFVSLAPCERAIVLEALELLLTSSDAGMQRERIGALARKIEVAPDYPTITVGVSGGQVQWARGNPFPIRICDYDGERADDLPDQDELGQRCRAWSEPSSLG